MVEIATFSLNYFTLIFEYTDSSSADFSNKCPICAGVAIYSPFTSIIDSLRIKRVIVNLTLHLLGLFINGSERVSIETDKTINDQNIKEKMKAKQ